MYTISGAYSQSIFGNWKTLDDETGKVESIIKIYKEDGKAYAKIIEIRNETSKNNVCDKCKRKNKDKPILGMVILDGLTQDDDKWSDGEILDPKNGKYYKCYIELVSVEKLKIRGYIGFSLLGRTAYWYRAED